jgi:hypothetical protein
LIGQDRVNRPTRTSVKGGLDAENLAAGHGIGPSAEVPVSDRAGSAGWRSPAVDA